MVPRSLRIRLTDIREEIAGIRELTKDADADRFAASWAMMRAVQHALLIIAEAAKHIPPELKNTRSEVPKAWESHGFGRRCLILQNGPDLPTWT
jgi:uncharacterized protein with HEPN domain